MFFTFYCLFRTAEPSRQFPGRVSAILHQRHKKAEEEGFAQRTNTRNEYVITIC